MSGEGWADYGLIDSGHGRKLERYGPHRFIRPERRRCGAAAGTDGLRMANSCPAADEDGGGRWQYDNPVPRDGWPLSWGDVKFTAQCTPFRHLGFFPDMAPVWDWMGQRLDGRSDAQTTLNLFGYTGVGTLALSANGPVTHVDASKKSVAQARGMPRFRHGRPSGALDRGRCRQVRRARSAARQGVMTGSSSIRPSSGAARRRGLAAGGTSARAGRRLPAVARRDSRFLFLTVYAVRHELAGPGRACSRIFARFARHGSNTAIWRCARSSRATAAFCPPPSSPAGATTDHG
jgi:23S rRNA (cytosine1962-C5)-methyltransferase